MTEQVIMIICVGFCQHAFHIALSGSYEVVVKNPTRSPIDGSSNAGLGKKQKAKYTKAQLEHFRGKRVDWLRWCK